MKTCSTLSRSLRRFAACSAALILAGAAFAVDPSGSWTVKATGQNGNELESKLTLKLDGSQLSGSVTGRAGTAKISNGKFADDQVSFTVSRRARLRKVEVVYTGKLEGDTIKGTATLTGPRGRSATVPWEATRETAAQPAK